MGYKVQLVCILVIYYTVECELMHTTNVKIVKQLNGKSSQYSEETLETSIRTKRGYPGGRNAVNPSVDMLVERLDNLETTLNNILKSQTEIKQNQNNIIQTFIKSHGEMKDEMNHIKTKTDAIGSKTDQLKMQSETFETRLTQEEHQLMTLVNISSRISHQLLLKDNSTRLLATGIQDVRRASSLLAITKIDTAELPYVAHCERTIGHIGEERHRIDSCIQTRLDELYNDLNSVLDVHVMLIGGRGPYEGRVEVIYNGQLGTVCNPNWDYSESKVVCRMLGYQGGSPIYRNRFGKGSGEFRLDYVACNGKENSIFACKHRIRKAEAGDCQLAAVKCRT